MKDFRKYAIGHKNINSSTLDSYAKMATPNIIDNSGQGVMIDVFSKMLENRIIFVCTEIEPIISNIIKAQLLYLEQLNDKEEIKMYIDSPGGDVYSGFGIIDTMEYISPVVSTVNTGLAASMGAIILACGEKGKRRALPLSRTMLHQPSSYMGYAQSSDILINAKVIENTKKEIYNILVEKTGQTYSKIEADSDRDYWMTAEETLKYGVIDEIVRKKGK